ncbi:acetyl-CoA carboxylase carboxyltransferase subunit alpha [bacterium]|nr:acetyl-CoA carboxylase carboxyltransferase subunit alpha [bacterium]
MFEFEKSLTDIQTKVAELKKVSSESGMDLSNEIEKFEQQAQEYKQEIYKNLKPSEKLQIARHANRPSFLDYVNYMCSDFIEMHGDREGTDDRAIIGGVAKLGDYNVMLVGTQKGSTTKENLEYNFGMPQPQGYRKAMRLFNHANKFNLPIITLIDTPGAYPGVTAEQTGQGIAIAQNLRDMAKLDVPVIAVITGEGCSGGALGLAVANDVKMLEYAYYTVISPEGCASILFRDSAQASVAADALKITADDLLDLGIIDSCVKEPLGGAHNNKSEMAKTLQKELIATLKKLLKLSPDKLKEQRYKKYRSMGCILNG